MKATYSCTDPWGFLGDSYQCSSKWLFCWLLQDRGHHPPLVNVDATDTDKRDELALCLLGEHPSGQRQVGFSKGAAPKLNSLDKREHLSLVDNLPTGSHLGWMPHA
jgi:hypothetical protein